ARPADPLPRTAAVGRHLETRIAGAFGCEADGNPADRSIRTVVRGLPAQDRDDPVSAREAIGGNDHVRAVVRDGFRVDRAFDGDRLRPGSTGSEQSCHDQGPTHAISPIARAVPRPWAHALQGAKIGLTNRSFPAGKDRAASGAGRAVDSPGTLP